MPVPLWVRAARLVLGVGVAAAILATAFVVNDWRWLAQGYSSWNATVAAVAVTAAVAAAVLLLRLDAMRGIFGLRKSHEGKWVYGGFLSLGRRLLPWILCAGVYAIVLVMAALGARSSPVPTELLKARYDVQAPRENENLVPLYLWDYATWFDPGWLVENELVLPYEKGPPEKLLPKLYFQNRKSQETVLELHGRRPRTYPQGQVYALFNQPAVHPRTWPLLFNLKREAGLVQGGKPLFLMDLVTANASVTQAVGVPWQMGEGGPGAAADPEAGRVFFWEGDGSVFQVRCPPPCAMSRLLELVQFPTDARGSYPARREWTAGMLRKLLAQRPADPKSHRNMLQLYLVSLLTLDPRDPEAFFHVGKLATNRETVHSAIRYGKDLGLEAAKIAELQMVADGDFPGN